MIERPELIQAHRTNRNEHLLLKAIIGCIIGLAAILVLANAPHAETVEVGIAPQESNTFNALSALEIVENPYQTIRISDSEYEELRWVLALAAQGEGLEGEILCCEVIFNRVLSQKNWGTGVHGVLAMSEQFVEYKYINSKRAWAFPGETEDKAISECLRRGPSGLPDMKYVYFDTGRKNGNRNIKIGRHWFGAEK